MRLFVAIQLNDDMTDALVGIQERMRAHGVRGNYTKPENLHLTLAFIGEHPDPEAVREALDTVNMESFRITLEGIGSFGRLWWAGIEESEALRALSRRVRRALAEHDIPFDRKKFSPHITLIRKPLCREGSIPEGVLRVLPQASMEAEYISLMRSDRSRNGMIYTEI
jgi:2'-5' RNA ligase